jgi:hypothetical protein
VDPAACPAPGGPDPTRRRVAAVQRAEAVSRYERRQEQPAVGSRTPSARLGSPDDWVSARHRSDDGDPTASRLALIARRAAWIASLATTTRSWTTTARSPNRPQATGLEGVPTHSSSRHIPSTAHASASSEASVLASAGATAAADPGVPLATASWCVACRASLARSWSSRAGSRAGGSNAGRRQERSGGADVGTRPPSSVGRAVRQDGCSRRPHTMCCVRCAVAAGGHEGGATWVIVPIATVALRRDAARTAALATRLSAQRPPPPPGRGDGLASAAGFVWSHGTGGRRRRCIACAGNAGERRRVSAQP